MAEAKEKIDQLAELAYAEQLASRYRLNFIDLDKFPIDYALVQSLPVDMMLRNKFVPLQRENGQLVIAMADPSDIPLLDELRAQLKIQLRHLSWNHLSPLLSRDGGYW